ncbi:MAG: DUF4173 domain-containing protein [Phycisphaerae bacterium]|jgi:hypothetical protein
MTDTAADQAGPAPAATPAPTVELRPGDVERARGFLPLLGIGVAFAVTADWLFWDQPRGWTVGAFGLLLAGTTLLWERQRVRRSAWIVLAALAGLLLQCVVEPGTLAVALAVLGLVTLAFTVREGWRASAIAWFERWGLMAALGWLSFFRDAEAWGRVERASGGGMTRSGARFLRGWLIPVVLTAAFFAVFAVANPVLARWVTNVWERLYDFVSEFLDRLPTAGRVLMWVLVGIAVWALLRYRAGTRVRTPNAAITSPRVLADFPSAALLLRCLVPFNLLFALQSVLDVRYLWWGAELPSGLTYAEYAHRGAYPLVGAALLAACFVLVAFRSAAQTPGLRWARRLVYLWLAQNLFLVICAVWRLKLYVEVYSLTRWRVAAAIWMLLVLAGLVWILWRIVGRRSGMWLINVNAITALAVLYACAFVDFDRWIADVNVAHCRELGGEGPPIDVPYLEQLGPESLPALARLAESRVDPKTVNRAGSAACRLRAALRSDLSTWRGWTWRRQCLADG